MTKRIYFSIDSDDCGCNDNSDQRNQFLNSIKSEVPGPAGKSVQGVPGKDNIVQGSQIGISGNDVPGNDQVLASGTIATLQAAGFDPTALETIRSTQDTTDLTNTRWNIRLSNAIQNWIAIYVIPGLVKTGGTTGQVYSKIDGSYNNGQWVDPGTVIPLPYKTTSITANDITTGNKTFVVSTGLQFQPNVSVSITKISNPSIYLLGNVVSYSGTTLVVSVFQTNGTGTGITDWNINIGSTPFLPDMTGKSAYVLSNDGMNPFWSQASTVPTGSAIDYYGTIPPDGWDFADGHTVGYNPSLPKSSSNQYKDLAIVMGANSNASPFYVSSISFKLPNRKRRVSVGFDSVLTGTVTGTYDKVGLTGGVDSANIALGQLPDHTHGFSYEKPNSGALAGGGGAGSVQVNYSTISSITTGITGLAAAETVPGVQDSLSKMQPYEVCNVIVKL